MAVDICCIACTANFSSLSPLGASAVHHCRQIEPPHNRTQRPLQKRALHSQPTLHDTNSILAYDNDGAGGGWCQLSNATSLTRSPSQHASLSSPRTFVAVTTPPPCTGPPGTVCVRPWADGTEMMMCRSDDGTVVYTTTVKNGPLPEPIVVDCPGSTLHSPHVAHLRGMPPLRSTCTVVAMALSWSRDEVESGDEGECREV